MPGRSQDGQWLRQLTPDARNAVKAIVRAYPERMRGDKDRMNQWWLRCSPTTGIHRNVTLLRKVEGITVREYPIMCNGELVTESESE